ncbi:MAG: tetratricopeptide repeat protein [Alphaproteobacteria bacterium]|nr:tetratricopeptide repeat protein [Alphaproteobacteria bacterium]
MNPLAEAAAAHKAGKLKKAIKLYRQVLKRSPNAVQIWCYKAAAHQQAGDAPGAVQCFQKALQIDPKLPDALMGLSALLLQQERHDDAITLISRLLSVRPGDLGAATNLAYLLNKKGDYDRTLETLAPFMASARKAAAPPSYWFNLAVAQHASRRFEDALASLDAIDDAAKPDRAIRELKADTLLELRRHDDAIAALSPFLTQEAPSSLRLAVKVSCSRRDDAQALAYAEGSVAASGEDWRAAAVKAVDLFLHYRVLETARRLARLCLERDPESPDLNNCMAAVLSASGWSEKAAPYFEKACAAASPEPDWVVSRLISSQYQPDISAATLFQEHKAVGALFKQKPGGKSPKKSRRPAPARILRLGFISPDFREHPVAQLVTPVLEALSQRADVESCCYYTQRSIDAMTQRVQNAAAEWRQVDTMSPERVIEVIRNADLDVLVDLAGHTSGSFVEYFPDRMAPIQATWAGYVGTTGVPNVDMLISDRHHTPEGEDAYYSETILRMPHGYCCFDIPPDAPSIALPEGSGGSGVTFGVLNKPRKINRVMLAAWFDILRQTPESRLLLRYGDMDDPERAAEFRRSAEAAGVDPDRLSFEGYATRLDFLETYNRVDIALDTWPYSGGVTTLEALLMATPTITRTGASFAGRHATSHLCNAGFPELVAQNLPDYIALAVGLAADPERLADYRTAMRDALIASPLCDPDQYAEDLLTRLRAVLSG